MQQFALASVYPRSIAWLVRLNEWERLETIVEYNCAMLGGCYNVLIQLNEDDTLSEKYQQFLLDYDPDFIVLAPDIQPSLIQILSQRFYGFCLIPWNEVEKIATLDPLDNVSHINATLMPTWRDSLLNEKAFLMGCIAVADQMEPDTSKLALIACGDIHPRMPLLNDFDGEIELDADGYREAFLQKFMRPEHGKANVMARLEYAEDSGYHMIPAPDRFSLREYILEDHCFPLSNLYGILNTCCRLQNAPSIFLSFIGLTSPYRKSLGPSRLPVSGSYPPLVILVSEHFDAEEAVLFWNLRAMDVYVAWLSLANIESHLEELDYWLEADSGGSSYILKSRSQIVFSTNEKYMESLNEIIAALKNVRLKKHSGERLSIATIKYENLIWYDYEKICIKQEHIPIIQDGNKITFLPRLPSEEVIGSYAIDLEYTSAMVSQNIYFTETWRRLYEQEFYWHKPYTSILTGTKWQMPYCRVNRNHYLRLQLHDEKPVEIEIPSLQSIAESLFQKASFSRVSLSNTARYHTIFIDRAGGLEQATHYLTNNSYRSLLETLVDNSSRDSIGWILEHPSQRRVLNHFDLWRMFNEPDPSKNGEEHYSRMSAYDYYRKLSDKLPEEVITLLDKQILERGFLITCNTCSFKSWYPAEFVGQHFTCARCFQTQIYQSNPLWLYKLPEIIYQGFNNDMHVPLLALSHMKRRSKYAFDWIPDSDVFWQKGPKELSRNIDIICACDGKFYVGEAKSSNSIDKEQFSFYQEVCQKVGIDGVIFATSQSHWDGKTSAYIKELRKHFSGEIIDLREKDLYENVM